MEAIECRPLLFLPSNFKPVISVRMIELLLLSKVDPISLVIIYNLMYSRDSLYISS